MAARDLCTLDDVTKRTPGYDAGDDTNTDATLAALITQESRDFVEACGREIVAMSTGVRTFDLTNANVARRQLRIGDAAAVSQVELFDYDDATSLGVIAPSQYVLLPRVRDDWEPIRRIAFPYRPMSAALMLAPGRTLHLSGTWGFPLIPDTVKFAVATFVIFRYINDVAGAGTQLSDAINRPEFNLAASLRAAMDVRDRLSSGPFA
jgi:hypothetical protein